MGEIAGENRRDGAQEQGVVTAARTPDFPVCLTTLLPQTTSLNPFLKPKDKNAATIFSEKEGNKTKPQTTLTNKA